MVFERPIVSFALKESMFSVDGAGVFVEPNDTDAMAKAILRLIHDKESRVRLGKKAKKRVIELSWDKTSLPLIEAYQQIQKRIKPHDQH
jgi:glycosyltransferase involved in cell wall biosynthesis